MVDFVVLEEMWINLLLKGELEFDDDVYFEAIMGLVRGVGYRYAAYGKEVIRISKN